MKQIKIKIPTILEERVNEILLNQNIYSYDNFKLAVENIKLTVVEKKAFEMGFLPFALANKVQTINIMKEMCIHYALQSAINQASKDLNSLLVKYD